MSPELEWVRRSTELVVCDAAADALSRAPQGQWSSLQVLEHLVLSYTATTRGLLRAMEVGRPERATRTLGHRLRGVYVLGVGRFPSGIDAPKQVVPRGGLGDDPLRRFSDALVAMDASLTDAERRFGRRSRVLVHPMLGPLTAQQWRRFHQVHGRHHLKQIKERLGAEN
ncbi:MAG TPA: DUF1569 domain-containing protein [Candidatus Angelobacter sp.]|nr:DUF1569 domain-containing protein [Candidatus Angelobacter sp.]